MLNKIRRIGIITLVIVAVWTMCSCKPEKKEQPAETVVDSYPAEQVQIPSEETPKQRVFWASDNVKLPAGRIVHKDCAGCQTGEDKNPNYKDNYIVVRRSSDSLMVLIKDVDEDVYLSTSVGEYVQ